MEKIAVIVGGGSGTRMGTEVPKQFLLLGGKPVLIHTLDAFFSAIPEISVILVLPDEYLERGSSLVHDFFPGRNIQLTKGGTTRFDSVKAGLSLVPENAIVFVHDAVRCLVTPALIARCAEVAMESGSAIPVVPLKDSIRRMTEAGSEVLDRSLLRAVQTPQVFRGEILLPAFQSAYRPEFTDEATVVEFHGFALSLVEGEEANIKITVREDMDYAEQFLARKKSQG